MDIYVVYHDNGVHSLMHFLQFQQLKSDNVTYPGLFASSDFWSHSTKFNMTFNHKILKKFCKHQFMKLRILFVVNCVRLGVMNPYIRPLWHCHILWNVTKAFFVRSDISKTNPQICTFSKVYPISITNTYLHHLSFDIVLSLSQAL